MDDNTWGRNAVPTSGGATRRSVRPTRLSDDAPAQTDPNADNWGAQAARSVLGNRANDLTSGVEYLARGVMGDDEGRIKAAKEYQAEAERVKTTGPRIQSLDDAQAAGGGVGDYAAYGAYALADMVPDIAMTATGVGVGGTLARRGARKAILGGIASEIEATAAATAARETAIKAATRRAALEAPDGAAAVSNAMKVARSETDDTFRKAALQEAVEIAGRTPRGAQLAGRIGGMVGGTAASVPTLNGQENAELAAQESTSQSDMWALAAGTTAAAATQVLPLERFIGKFGAKARAEVAKKADGFLSRTAKEVLKQGNFEGMQEVAQDALQNASQAYVMDNPDVLWSPDAAKGYLASYVVGGALGGLMGGVGEGTRAVGDGVAHVAGAGMRAARGARDVIKERLQKAGDAARATREGARAGQEIPLDGADVAGGTAAPGGAPDIRDLFRGGVDAVSGAVTQGMDAVKGATAKFKTHFDSLVDDDDLDGASDSLLQDIEARNTQFEATGDTEGPEAKSYTLPVQMPNKFQDILMRTIDKSTAIWEVPDLALEVGAAMELEASGRTGDMTPRQRYVVDAMVESPNSGFDKVDLNRLRSIGPDAAAAFNKSLGSNTERAPEAAGDTPLNSQMSDAFAVARQVEQEAAQAGDELDTSGDTTDVESDQYGNSGVSERAGADAPRPIDTMNALRQTRDTLDARIERAPESVKAALVEERNAAAVQHNSIKAKLREEILGDKNTAWSRVGKFAADFDAKLKSPNGVLATDLRKTNIVDRTGNAPFKNAQGEKTKKGEHAYEPQVIDLAGLANRQVGADSNMSGRDAVLAGLADLQVLGIGIDPSTFTPGNIELSNGQVFATIVDGPADASQNQISLAELKGLAAPVGTRAGRAVKTANIAARDTRAGQQKAHVNRFAKEVVGKEIRDTLNKRANEGTLPKGDFKNGKPVPLSPTDLESRSATFQEDRSNDRNDAGELSDANKGKLVARESPRATLVPGNRKARGEFVSSQDPVSDVRFNTPYAKIVAKVRRMQEAGGAEDIASASGYTKDEIIEAKFKAGIEIGKAELARESAAGMSAPRLAKALRRLENFDSGEAAKYWNNASRGKYDTASVSNAAVDTEEVAKGDARDDNTRSDALPESSVRPVEAPKTNPGVAKSATHDKDLKRASKETGKTIVKKTAFDSVVDIGDAKPGEFDHKAEQNFANAVMKALGFDWRMNVGARTDNARAGSFSINKVGEIRLGDGLFGAERVEVLSHEIGHGVIIGHIAKLLGVDPLTFAGTHIGVLDGDALMGLLEKHDPKLFAGLEADYNTWVASQDLRGSAVGVVASRSPFFRAEGATKNGGKKQFNELSTADKRYVLGMNEWMADNIARALTQDVRGQSLVEKFFGGIADVLRKAYAMMFGKPEAAKWAPAPSVDAWVKGMFDANAKAVKTATGVSTSPAAAESIVAAATVVVTGGPKPKVKIAAPKKKTTKAAPKKKAKAAAPDFAAIFHGQMEYVRNVLPSAERLMLERVLSRPENMSKLEEYSKTYWEDKVPGITQKMSDAKVGMETRIAMGYLAYRSDQFNRPGVGAKQVFTNWTDNLVDILGASSEAVMVQRVFEDWQSGRIEQLVKRNDTYSVRELEAKANGTAQAAFNWLAKPGPVSNAMASFWTGINDRMHNTGVPAARKLAALLQRPQGTTNDEDRGLIPAVRTKTLVFHRKFTNVLKGLTEKETELMFTALQRRAVAGEASFDKKSPKLQKAIADMRALMSEAFDYGSAEDVGMFEDGRQAQANYFPVMMDIADDSSAKKLGELYSKSAFREAILDKFNVKGKDRTDEQHAKLVQLMVNAAMDGDMDADTTPAADAAFGVRADKQRFSDFIYTNGTEADRHAFAKLQTKNPDEIFARYFNPLVKAAEARRRFGERVPILDKNGDPVISKKTGQPASYMNPRGKLDKMLAQIKEQGGTDADVTLAENAVKAAMGTYGTDMSPTLSAISPDLAKKFSGPRTKAFIQNAQAYQNIRLLPLALLSSLVDPMGIAVRSGGDFTNSFNGFKAGMRTLFNKNYAAEMHAMLEELGLADDFMPAIASHPMFEEGEKGFARRVSEGVFKFNGMNAWVQANRVMAAHAGSQFLLHHAASTEADSKRYLAELSITPADIKADKNGKLILNDKTKAAVQQFVDEAILRPNALQSPLWHRDPYMGLVTQYKAFSYAIYDQISKRISLEFSNGNYRVLLAAMAYLPVAMMAELIREFIQYAGEGNPRREEWGAGEYTMLAAERTGLPGPKYDITDNIKGDIERRNIPGTSQLGPTGGQANNLIDAFTGRRSLPKELESGIPTSTLWKKWNDGNDAADPKQPLTDEAA